MGRMIATRTDELTVPDAARILGVTGMTVGRWCRARKLNGRHRDGHWYPLLATVTALARHRRRVRQLRAA
jgi:hypothetical protein